MGDRLPRKLAAILYADVAGYSRLTGEVKKVHTGASSAIVPQQMLPSDIEGRVCQSGYH